MYRILSIDTFDKDRSPLAEIYRGLESRDFELDCRPPAGNSLAAIMAQPPDLVLIDPDLPDEQAFLICKQLKNSEETENIPVIFLHRGESANGIVAKSLDCGGSDFISLDMAEPELVARLKAAIRDKQAASQSAALARQLNKMHSELYERNLQVERELYVARQLQQSLLPPFLTDEENCPNPASPHSAEPMGTSQFSKCHYRDERLRISGVYLPCDALGGDIYDVIKFPNGTIGVAIADVSGHGVPAGFITAIFKSSFYRITHGHSTPGNILYHLNNELADIIKTGEYVTSVYCRIRPDEDDTGKLMLDYSGAGHPYPIYYNASEQGVNRLKENGTPLVWVKNMEYPMGSIYLKPGDKVLLFTDGVSEMRNPRGDFYGEDKLEATFRNLIDHHPDRILDTLIQQLSDFTEGHPLEDDLSVVLIEAL